MTEEETTVGIQDNQVTLTFASVSGKQVEAVFDGGVLTSDMGVMLLREVASRTGILSRQDGSPDSSACVSDRVRV